MEAATKPVLTLDFTASHTVYKNAAGKRVPGVTTVLGMLDKPALLRWAWQLGKDGKELDRSRQTAADIGTVAHALIEAHLRGMELDTSVVAPALLTQAETSFLQFLEWWTPSGFAVVASELQMVSERMQVGGTLDVLAEKPGTLALVDLKTSKAIYDEHLVQAATYAAIYEENHGTAIDDVLIVRIPKDEAGRPEVRYVDRRAERVAAFAALATARRALQACGMKV